MKFKGYFENMQGFSVTYDYEAKTIEEAQKLAVGDCDKMEGIWGGRGWAFRVDLIGGDKL